MTYSDDDMLMLSGIQHFRFCPRQWALIHIEQQWEDNRLTAEGHILHKRVDDPFYRQKCGDYISLRSVSIASHQLGLYGITDVVELHPTDNGDNSIRHPSIRVCGSLTPWSTNTGVQSAMRWTRCSWRHRRCAWRNSTASRFHTGRSSMRR